MLNTTKVIRYIEMHLGYRFSQLEITHEEILDLIDMETLITFSKYFPYQGEPINIDCNKDKVEGHNNIYYIDSETEILNVNKMIPNAILGPYTLVTDLGINLNPSIYSNPIAAQLDMDLYSTTKNPVTFRFIHPNKIEVTPMTANFNNFTITVNRVHPNHFGTIPNLLRTEFLTLALYDVQIMLYKIRSRFQNIQTTFGEMNLMLDDLSNASSARQELIEKFHANILKNPTRKKLIIA